MNFFDLLFLLLLAAAIICLFAAGYLAVRRDFSRSARILRNLSICAAAYMAIVIAVSLCLRREVLKPGANKCFDDWCIAVSGFKRLARGSETAYDIDLRLSSRARRVSQRENDLSVYLTDQDGRRYTPVTDTAGTAFNVLLHPGESSIVSRTFLVPASAKNVGFVITHEGGFPIEWFIIGYDTWFRRPAMVQLP
jgi:hypothetical protein